MKVLHINTSDRDGGAAVAAMRIHKGLRDMGVQSVFLAQKNLSGDVDVVFPKGKKNRIKTLFNSQFDPLIRKVVHAETKHPWSMGYAPFDLISSFLTDESFDVIHLHWINGGFFVLDRKVLDRIHGDDSVFEQEPMRSLSADGQLEAWRHTGFWQPMDTLRDKHVLEELWASGKAPWKSW